MLSLTYYFWGAADFVYVIFINVCITYLSGLLISRNVNRCSAHLTAKSASKFYKKSGLLLSVIGNLFLLGYFKYYNFGIQSLNEFSGFLGFSYKIDDFAVFVLPLGISFYTFKSLSYTIDVYLGNIQATKNIIDLTCYITLFPQLIAGPIARYTEMESKLLSLRIVTSAEFMYGIERFIIGLGKKVLIANTLSTTVDIIFKLNPGELTSGVAWLGICAYTLQIYFDFSGYSDMAIGLCKMFGFNCPENFNYPYIAKSIQDFWRRWHITLSKWFKDYLYIPLGGNRTTQLGILRNLLTVFILCGLWHGANWTFIIWGLYHGIFLSLERIKLFKRFITLNKVTSHVYALMVIMIGWVFFRSNSLTAGLYFISVMFGADYSSPAYKSVPLERFLSVNFLFMLAIGIIFSTPAVEKVSSLLHFINFQNIKSNKKIFVDAIRLLLLFVVFFLSIMSLAEGTHQSFIYFQF